jgi:hypothetical protein
MVSTPVGGKVLRFTNRFDNPADFERLGFVIHQGRQGFQQLSTWCTCPGMGIASAQTVFHTVIHAIRHAYPASLYNCLILFDLCIVCVSFAPHAEASTACIPEPLCVRCLHRQRHT